MIFNKTWITDEICSVSSSIALGFVFFDTWVFASGHTVHGQKNLRCKVRFVVDAEKHESGPHLVNIMDRATYSAEAFAKY